MLKVATGTGTLRLREVNFTRYGANTTSPSIKAPFGMQYVSGMGGNHQGYQRTVFQFVDVTSQ